MAASSNFLPQDLLKVLFDYDPSVGHLIWKIPYGRSKRGDKAGFHIKCHGKPSPLYMNFGNRQYSIHVLIWIWMTGEPPTVEVDHENRDNNDNRWDNLRHATRGQNQTNTGLYKNNKCGARGVHRQGNRWRAVLSIDNQTIHVGCFGSKEEAAAAWEAEALRYRGDFARH